MNELETSIVDIDDNALESLFNETPDKTPNANTLLGGKKTAEAEVEDIDEEEEEVEEQPKKKKAKPQPPVQRTDTIEDIDLDDIDESEEEEEDEEETEETKKKSAKATSRAKKTEGEGDAEEVLEEEDKKKKGAAKDSPEVLNVLKSTVNYLVEAGIWQDWEGREELEVDNETYAKIVAAQDKARVENMFGELVDSTGVFGKAIIDFVKNGGNPDEIIDLFKEQKSVEAINITEVDGQKELIKHYYSEVMGWKPATVEKHINRLLLSNELEDEAKEVKDLAESYYKKEASRLNSNQEEFNKQQKAAEEAFESNVKTSVRDRKDLTPSERKNVEEYLLAYDQRLPNGKMVNKFYVNFLKMQANPADYIDLALFVMDKQKFVQKVQVTEKSKAAAEAFKFIKGNGAVSTKKGTSHEQIKTVEKATNFDWGIPTKRS